MSLGFGTRIAFLTYDTLGHIGIGGSSFAVRQKVGIWGEATFLHHFRTHPEHGLSVFEYGEALTGKKKAQGHAVCRPDLLLIETDQLRKFAEEGINLNVGIDLRRLRDDDPTMQQIVRHALAAVEVKFSHRRFENCPLALFRRAGL